MCCSGKNLCTYIKTCALVTRCAKQPEFMVWGLLCVACWVILKVYKITILLVPFQCLLTFICVHLVFLEVK